MISDLIKKDFSYARKINFLFVIIISVLVVFSTIMACVSYNHLGSTLNEENEGFVHNVATFFLKQQLKTLENALWQNTVLLDNECVEALVKSEDEELEKKLTASISMLPAISGYIIATRDGRYNSIPKSYVDSNYILAGRTWYERLSAKSSFVNYSEIYANAVDGLPVVTIAKLLHDDKGERYGVFAMDLNLINLSQVLRQLESPSEGHLSIVDRRGRAILDADSDAIGTPVVPQAAIHRMTNGLGSFHDKVTGKHYYYYSFSNPDFEITDNSVMLDDAGRENAARLRETGFLLAWDDIHSVEQLQDRLAQVETDFIKLDRSCFKATCSEETLRIIRCAQESEVDVIAEGVETFSQMQMLFNNNVRLAQGYLFSRPLSRDNFRQKHLQATEN
ncbi:cache domain-containing protein [Cedecea sp. NFIX57]|uniref:cache domain-containing protein n=1 Tax=Cedecea sp. NFIX57 TaxID=1566286 RepID=UPI000A0CD40B|nr:cache domain-containing protein [Cedecea sp. NFIX57]SMG11606.1 EAL domain-containing protein [Cedecea sp. NFIX57]